jgi:anti-sigma-K factor RskA
MSMNDRPDDMDELLAAYALDAVDDDERRVVEAYLVSNPEARAEVDEHREVMSLVVSGAEPADGVWDRIVDALDGRQETAPEPGPELAKVLPAKQRKSRAGWWLGGLAAAAAVAVIAALSVALVRDDTEQQAGGIVAAYDAAKGNPVNKTVALLGTDGTTRATAVVEPSGRAYLDPASLPALGDDRTYQLWGVLDDNTPVSLGVLGPDPELTMFGVSGPVKALAITDERAGGVVSPEKPPPILGTLQ